MNVPIQPPARPTPTTDAEWTVHALNIQGVFFERLCQKLISEAPGWQVRSTKYPVEFPAPSAGTRGQQGELDIRAQHAAGLDGALLLSVLIECKKNNPDFIDWVFFPKNGRERQTGSQVATFPVPSIKVVRFLEPQPKGPRWDVRTRFLTPTLLFRVADEAWETRGDYIAYNKQKSDKTRTTNSAVTAAAKQVALATQAIFSEEADLCRDLAYSSPPSAAPFEVQSFVPLIVTTAKLWFAEFDAGDIDLHRGELDFSRATLVPAPAVIYEYPLPRSLQMAPGDIGGALANTELEWLFMRMNILVVNVESLAMLLGSFIATDAQFLI